MIQSVERALDLVEAVSSLPGGAGLSELAQRVNLKVQTANTLLKTLVAKKYLLFDEGARKYSLGFELLRMAGRIEGRHVMERTARLIGPQLDTFYKELGEQLLVTMYFRDQFFVVGRKEADVELRPSEYYFVERPHHLATGTVILAHRPPAFIEAYFQAHPDAKKLRPVLKAIRADGVYNRKDKNGHIALAVPVVSADQDIHLSVGCFFSPLNKGRGVEKRVLGVLRKTAEAIAPQVAF